MPLRSIRDEPQRPSRPAAQPAPAPPPKRRKKFQFPLYILLVMMTVIGLALVPASYMMRSTDEGHSHKMWNLIYLLAWPMILVIFIHSTVRLYSLIRRR
jgi:hypothetical protein